MNKLITILIACMIFVNCGTTNNCPAYAQIECQNCDEID